MSDNPLIEGFLKLHEAGGIGGGMSGTKFSNAANHAPAVGAGVRGAFNNFTMGAGPYGRAAVDYSVKNLGSLAGVSEPTTFYKELEQENEKDTAAKRDFPDAYKAGEIGSTAAQALGGAGAVTAVIKAGLKSATAKNTVNTIAKNADADDFQLGSKNALILTPKMRAPLKLTQQMRTEEENDSSEGNTEMSTNPYIKGFFDIEEARAKNTNIFDESKRLTAAQKEKLDKNNNGKIDAKDFEMLRKEEVERDEFGYGYYGDKHPTVISPETRQGKFIQGELTGLHTAEKQKPYKKGVDFDDPESYTHRVFGHYRHRGDDKPISLDVRAPSEEEAKKIASEQLKNFRPKIVKQLTNEGLDENAWNQLGQKKPVGDILPAPAKGVVPKHGKKFEEGDSVIPHTGPHAGERHVVTSSRAGSVNIVYRGKSGNDKYNTITVRAKHEHLSPYTKPVAEEADLDEAKKAKPGHNASVMANKAAILTKFLKKKNEDEDEKIDEANILPSNFSDRTTPVPNKKAYAIDKANSEKKKPVSLKKAPFDMKKEEVEFSEEEIDFINNVMEAMPVAPTSENDSPNPTQKNKAEGSRAKGSMAD